jgi:3-hydroxyisobutyrate dehydrogenase-like beta-hydroxyacid dehydrogenase
MKVAVVAAGTMGAGIGARLRESGAQVFTSVAGRGPATARRAEAAGLVAIDDDLELVGAVDVLLSIVPPGDAQALAARFAPGLTAAKGRVLYVDCNAVAPQTVAQVGETVRAAGSPFADVGIIGAPPRPGGPGPRLYASGEALDGVMRLKDFGLDVRPVPGGVGQASALKMAYGSLTKGLTALGASMALAATAAGVEDLLAAELAASQPELLAWLSRQVPSMPPKAYRWVPEMEEVARFMPDLGGAQMFTGAAAVYAQLEGEEAAEPARLLAQWFDRR